MITSDEINEIAAALAKAQGEIEDASKTGLNPAFRSKYADLAAVRAVIREPLAKNNLAVTQFPSTNSGEVTVQTMLVHTSGQYMSCSLTMPCGKWDAHGIGSAITYARRYGLMSILCIASDDDDGNAAVEAPRKPAAPAVSPADKDALMDAGRIAAEAGTLADWWSKLPKSKRDALTAEDRIALKNYNSVGMAEKISEG